MSIIDLKQKTTDRLPLKPIKTDTGEWLHNGLVPAKLVAVKTEDTVPEKGEFAGQTLKILRFEFQNIPKGNDPDRFLSHIENMVGTKKKINKADPDSELTDMDTASIEKLMVEQWKRIKHITEQFSTSPNYVALADVKVADYNKYLKPITASLKGTERVNVYNAYLQFICDYINKGKNDKPMFLDSKDESLTFWLLLLPNYGSRNHYEVPNFTGKGFIEPLVILKDGKFKSPKVLEIPNKAYLELGSIRANANAETDSSPNQELDDDLKSALGV